MADPSTQKSFQRRFIRASLTLPLKSVKNLSNRRPDIGFLPTPANVVDAALDLAEIQPNDRLYDLGSGDGRLLIAAAQRFGISGVGIDIDRDRVAEARQKALQAGLSQLLAFYQQDLYTCDFSEATVVFLYLLPHLNLRLRPLLFAQLAPGARVISLDFDMADWLPDRVISIPIEEDEVATLYRWVIPDTLPPELIP